MASFVRLDVLCVSFLLSTGPIAGGEVGDITVRYVDSRAEGVNDGSSWEDAWTDLQTALFAQ